MAMGARAKGLLALLLCAHCSLGFVAALGGLALAWTTAPAILGVRLDLFLVPFAILSAFFGWLWWGRRAADQAEVCAVPGAPAAADPKP
jgi:hypothetical protein